jgi:hypothetical protein
MRAGGLFVVMFRHHLAGSAVGVRRDFNMNFEFNYHDILLMSVLQHRQVPLNVRTYSVLVFTVYFATLSVFKPFLCRQIINMACII